MPSFADRSVNSTHFAMQRRTTAAFHQAKANAAQAWMEKYPAESAWLSAQAPSFGFAASLLSSLHKWGQLTDKQLATVQRLASAPSPDDRAAAAPTVSIDAIEGAFYRAKEAGLAHPKLRLDTFTFSPAPAGGKNPGAVYVKEGGVYLGKVAGGKLFTVSSVDQSTTDRILAVASDPKAAAIAYGQKFGKCSVCARDLTDEESISAGIGPVCAKKYGWA
jgi:hypothetical protein